MEDNELLQLKQELNDLENKILLEKEKNDIRVRIKELKKQNNTFYKILKYMRKK